MLVSFAIGYSVCSVFAYGITFGYFQNKYYMIAKRDKDSDRVFSLLPALLGPIGLIIALFLSEFCKYGIKFG